MDSWNGVLLLKSHIQHPPDIHIFTDASGSWGCGATWDKGWFQSPWSSEWANINVAAKELVPIVLATALWGKQWQAKHIQFHSDNMAVVHILKTNSSKDATIMHLLRCLHFFCAKHDIRMSTVHILGVQNVMAVALSRNNIAFFFQLSPHAPQSPMLIPQQLWEAVVENQPDWLSPSWRARLKNI